MGVDGDAGHAERVAEDHVGGLAADAGQGDELVERARHLAVVPLDQCLAQLISESVLFRKKPVGSIMLLQLGPVGRRRSRRPSGSARTASG